VLLGKQGFPNPNKEGIAFLLVILILLTPIINLIYLLFMKGESWLSLYFQRKAAEERKRITELKANKDS
jgi:hypothetical protein